MGQADVLSRPLASSRVSRGNPIRSAEVDPDRPLEPSDEIDAGRCKVTPVCGVQMKLSLPARSLDVGHRLPLVGLEIRCRLAKAGL